MKLSRFFCGTLSFRHGWIRLFGVGIAWKDTRLFKPLFSERYGYRKSLVIGSWSFTYLPKLD